MRRASGTENQKKREGRLAGKTVVENSFFGIHPLLASPKKFSKENLIRWIITATGWITVIILTLIMLLLFTEGLPIFSTTNPFSFIFTTDWYPVSDPPVFGILSFIVGSLMVTLTALVIAVPIGVAASAFLAEIATPTLREIIKPIIELLAGLPSIVLGFIGFLLLAPVVQNAFHLSTGLNGLTAGIMLAFICLPTIVSISEDSLSAVPKEYKEAAYALGATKWQTIRRVLIPAARSGIMASVMLGVGRAIGETMVVLMVAGGRLALPNFITDPLSAMTGRIAIEINNAVFGGLQYQALFAMGIVLFLMTLAVNIIADLVLEKQRRRYA
ncbi:MAG: phosphate ABC transporter permease subunit PstC [Coprothermobacterota bacterium]|nr:phosphate ABC transporter permease subunit PstC [Coprothermobacterota bacterium]